MGNVKSRQETTEEDGPKLHFQVHDETFDYSTLKQEWPKQEETDLGDDWSSFGFCGLGKNPDPNLIAFIPFNRVDAFSSVLEKYPSFLMIIH